MRAHLAGFGRSALARSIRGDGCLVLLLGRHAAGASSTRTRKRYEAASVRFRRRIHTIPMAKRRAGAPPALMPRPSKICRWRNGRFEQIAAVVSAKK